MENKYRNQSYMPIGLYTESNSDFEKIKATLIDQLTAIDELVSRSQDVCHRLRQNLETRVFHLNRQFSMEENENRVDDVESTVQQDTASLLPESRFDILWMLKEVAISRHHHQATKGMA